jgi:serine/threonine protein kinase
MKYLSSQNIVHRDLAARNLLVSSGTTEGTTYLVKVAGERTCITCLKCSDFGMARILGVDKDYYKTDIKVMVVPVKWCAPEVLQNGKFSTASGWNTMSAVTQPLLQIVGHLALLFGRYSAWEW